MPIADGATGTFTDYRFGRCSPILNSSDHRTLLARLLAWARGLRGGDARAPSCPIDHIRDLRSTLISPIFEIGSASRIDFTSEDMNIPGRFNPDLHRIALNPYNRDSDEISNHNALVNSPA
jgi:hypothetical protein